MERAQNSILINIQMFNVRTTYDLSKTIKQTDETLYITTHANLLRFFF